MFVFDEPCAIEIILIPFLESVLKTLPSMLLMFLIPSPTIAIVAKLSNDDIEVIVDFDTSLANSSFKTNCAVSASVFFTVNDMSSSLTDCATNNMLTPFFASEFSRRVFMSVFITESIPFTVIRVVSLIDVTPFNGNVF